MRIPAAGFLLFSALFWWNASRHLRPAAPYEDARQYLTMAYHLRTSGTLSLSGPGEPRAVPSAYREPGYPLLLAAGMGLSPQLRRPSPEFLDSIQRKDLSGLERLVFLQFFLLYLASLLAGAGTYALGGGRAAGFMAAVLTGLSPTLGRFAGSFLSETLCMLLMLGVSAALLGFERLAGRRALAAAGLLLALLVLTKAAFLYSLPLFCAYVAWVEARRGKRRGEILRAVCVFAATALVSAGAWMARNRAFQGTWRLTERAGLVLEMRAEFDRMSLRQSLAACLYYTPLFEAKEILRKRFGPEDLHGVEGGFWIAAHKKQAAYAGGQDALGREALQTMLRNPLRHLLVTFPLVWQSVFVEEVRGWPVDRRSARAPRLLLALLNVLLFFSFLVAAFGAAASRDAARLGFLLPPVFSFLFYALLTHNIPRYTQILIPYFWVCALLGLKRLWESKAPSSKAGAS